MKALRQVKGKVFAPEQVASTAEGGREGGSGEGGWGLGMRGLSSQFAEFGLYSKSDRRPSIDMLLTGE